MTPLQTDPRAGLQTEPNIPKRLNIKLQYLFGYIEMNITKRSLKRKTTKILKQHTSWPLQNNNHSF